MSKPHPVALLVLLQLGTSLIAADDDDRNNRPPNLLFILTDQQRHDALGAAGNSRIRTPNLDHIARRGIFFERAYVAFPVCSPDRASLQNGLYPHTHGTWDNNIPLTGEYPTLVEIIKQANPGYAAAYYGKWHLGNEQSRQRGFDDFDTTENYDGRANGVPRSGYYHFLLRNGIQPDDRGLHSRDLANRLPKRLSKPVYLANQAIRFIDQHREQPFMLYLGFLEPHAFADHNWGPPFANINQDLYSRDNIEIPDTFYEDMDPTVSFQKRLHRVLLQHGKFPPAYPQTEAELKDTIARYWGLVTLVDEAVGRVMDHLRTAGLADNTIVVFTSEHGEMLGDHRLMSKMVTYEESIRVPLLLAGPGLPARRVAKPVSQIDLVPTLLDLLGHQRPRHLQGHSLAAELRSGRAIADRDVVIESTQKTWEPRGNLTHTRTIVTPDGWKLSASEVGDTELYNLRLDPRERQNLASRTDRAAKVQELFQRIRRWQVATNDTVQVSLQGRWPEAYFRASLKENIRSELNKPWPSSATVRGTRTHDRY